jgi:outer membrane protein TolC
MTLSRRFALIGLALLAAAASAQAQTGFGYSNGQDYTKAKPLFPNVLAPYTARSVAKPNFTNSTRVEQLLKDGKLMLSLNDAISLALENNLDLSIARYNLSIADTEILRTKSGSATQGVNTGIVQGTPGGAGISATGASGSGAGGTSSGAGGVGSGSGGIVTSTSGSGPAVPSFDPVFTTGMSLEHSSSPQANTRLTGIPLLQQNTAVANFGYTQGFVTGTTFSVNYNNNRSTSNSPSSLLNPQLNSNYRITLQQHLLQGFSLASNNRFIRIAKNNREISDVAFHLQVITTVGQIQNIYWDLVNAYENVKAKQRALDLANRLLADNEKQVKIGTLAPIEVVRAQSQAASASQDLIVAQTGLQLQQLYMKNALSRNLTDPLLVAAEVIPTQPLTTVWSEYSPLHNSASEGAEKACDDAFIDMSCRLLADKLDFHYGNENLIAKYGGVDGASIRVGKHSYSCVVVPPSNNIKSSTLELLGGLRQAAAG